MKTIYVQHKANDCPIWATTMARLGDVEHNQCFDDSVDVFFPEGLYRVNLSPTRMKSYRKAVYHGIGELGFWVYFVGRKRIILCSRQAGRFAGASRNFYFQIKKLKESKP